MTSDESLENLAFFIYCNNLRQGGHVIAAVGLILSKIIKKVID